MVLTIILGRSGFILTLVLLLYTGFMVSGQEGNKVLSIWTDGDQDIKLSKSFSGPYTDSSSVWLALQDLLWQHYDKGFLTATIDSVTMDDSVSYVAWLNRGKQYKLGSISFDLIDPSVLRKTGVRVKHFEGKSFDFSRITKAKENIIKYYEDQGFPFACIRLDSLSFKGDTISAVCMFEKNSYVIIDSIIIKGDAKITDRYLYEYLGINPGDAYDESKIKNIGNRLKELVFISEIRPYDVSFTNDKARIYLYLKNKKASQFNGIIGVLPNNQTTGKMLITGDVKLFLQNSLGHGEIASANWQKLETQTQKLEGMISYPYLFHTPFGVDADFSMFKKDTSYLSVGGKVGLQYLLQGGNYVKAYVDRKSSELLSTAGLANITALPPYADVSSLLYGIAYRFERLDYRYNPRRGYALNANIGAGKKTVKKNIEIPEELYENIQLVSAQIEAGADYMLFIPIGRKMTVMYRNHSAHISNSSLFENELFRLGGFKSIRGFDEESLLASSYSVNTLEYRFLFEQNSNFYVFCDGAWYEKKLPRSYVRDTPIGFGVGMNLETTAGIFSISYALGRQFDNPIEIRSAKIHFGYVNRF